MIHLSAEVVSGLGEDTFWTWFHREFPQSTFERPAKKIGPDDAVLQYSTLGRSRLSDNSVALLWELYPEMKRVFQSNEWDDKLARIAQCARHARYRVVASRLTVPDYEQYGPIDVLPIGVDANVFRPLGEKESLRAKYGVPVGRRVGFWAGTLHPMKGYSRLLDWKRDHPEVFWIVVWKSPVEMGHLSDALNFIQVNQQTLAELMNCADFQLCCGMLRPFFMVEWEAMACNVPPLILDGQQKDFVPRENPREDVFRLGWDRGTAEKLWKQYLEERFPRCATSTENHTAPRRQPSFPAPSLRGTPPGPTPRVSIASLIYKSTGLADWIHDSLIESTPMLASGEAEFYFVANDAEPRVLAHLARTGYPHVVLCNPRWTEEELAARGIAQPEYLHRVYRAWNEAIKRARGKVVVLLNSDMFVSPGWLENLLKHLNPGRIVCAQLVERRHPRHGVFPGAYHAEFGSRPKDFRKAAFLEFCAQRSEDRLRSGGAYMPSACYKDALVRAGLYPEGNLVGVAGSVRYGDQVLFDTLGKQGVEHVTAMDSLVYHLKEGEMDEEGPGGVITRLRGALRRLRAGVTHCTSRLAGNPRTT